MSEEKLGQRILVVDDERNMRRVLQALLGALVAAVEDEPVRVHDRGRPHVLLIPPEDRAGSRAAGAEDALRRVVEAGSLLGGLQALLARLVPVGDQERQHRTVGVEERIHVDDEVLDDRQAEERRDRLGRVQYL